MLYQASHTHNMVNFGRRIVESTKFQLCSNFYVIYSLHRHPAGTCRMGTVKDKRSVVDSKLRQEFWIVLRREPHIHYLCLNRVLNTQNLRVIDASIMPVVVNANTMAPTMMIGEKGSDFIREHWSQQLLVCDLRHHVFNSFKDAKCFYSLLM